MTIREERRFLERASYRRRRLEDAARILPVIGGLLVMLPMIWTGDGAGAEASTARGGVYLFCAWSGLILAAALISRRLARPRPDDVPPG